MGALSPLSAWIPEDDILLKNAVEAGASLESLAKGAVHFSRRFTVQELQDRWYSLLYDPVVSADASARMIEFECTTPTPPSKFIRLGNLKENKGVAGKRKAESVRSSYYALCKRICTEPFNSMELNYLVAPSNGNYAINGDEPVYGNFMTGDPISIPFGFEASDMDTMHHDFPQNLMDGGTDIGGVVTADTFNTGLQNPAEEHFPMEQKNIHNESPQIIGGNLPITGNECEVEEFSQLNELPDCSLFNADDLGMKPPYSLDRINGGEGNVCSKFEGNQVFNSPISDSGASFHNLEYSSALPGMPMWREDPAPAMPADVGHRENDICTGDAFDLPDDMDAKNTTTSGYDAHLGMEVKVDMPCGDFKRPDSAEGYLAELSNTLLNFTNEEELMFMSGDGKDVIDKSYYDGLSSLLLSSPNRDVTQEQTTNITEPETSAAPVMYPINPSITYPGVVVDNRGSPNGENMACLSETQVLSSSTASNSKFPELRDGVICCTLNTEDWDIPCNDDVFLPNHLPRPSTSSTGKWNFQEANKPISSSVKDFPGNQGNSDTRPCFMQKEQKNPGESHGSSQIKGSQMGLKPPLGNYGVKYEQSKTDPTNLASTKAGHVSGGLGQTHLANESTNPLPGILKEEIKESILLKGLSYNSTESHMQNPDLDYDSFKSYPQTSTSGTKQELDASAIIRDHQSLDAEVMPTHIAVLEPEVNPQTSDQEGLFESDDGVPCYSDIEAMILDMDLDPDDQDLYYSEEVTKYQNEDTKRAIIRLEQGAYAYVQRAIAAHGAFAILYGRRFKHYIKKPEVLLGRATEDVSVDIDLGREGHGNKISRRQAMVNMDKGGSFYLKNLGKCSISVNRKEVSAGQSLSLSSSCLIEIRGMPFIFETNQTCVKRYLDSITMVSPKQELTQEHQP